MNKPFPDDELLSGYLDGELTAEEQSVVERALQESEAYRQLYEELKSVRSRLQSLLSQEPRFDFTEQILARAEKEKALDATDAKQDDLFDSELPVAAAMPVAASPKTPQVTGGSDWRRLLISALSVSAVVLLGFLVLPALKRDKGGERLDVMAKRPAEVVTVPSDDAPAKKQKLEGNVVNGTPPQALDKGLAQKPDAVRQGPVKRDASVRKYDDQGKDTSKAFKYMTQKKDGAGDLVAPNQPQVSPKVLGGGAGNLADATGAQPELAAANAGPMPNSVKQQRLLNKSLPLAQPGAMNSGMSVPGVTELSASVFEVSLAAGDFRKTLNKHQIAFEDNTKALNKIESLNYRAAYVLSVTPDQLNKLLIDAKTKPAIKQVALLTTPLGKRADPTTLGAAAREAVTRRAVPAGAKSASKVELDSVKTARSSNSSRGGKGSAVPGGAKAGRDSGKQFAQRKARAGKVGATDEKEKSEFSKNAADMSVAEAKKLNGKLPQARVKDRAAGGRGRAAVKQLAAGKAPPIGFGGGLGGFGGGAGGAGSAGGAQGFANRSVKKEIGSVLRMADGKQLKTGIQRFNSVQSNDVNQLLLRIAKNRPRSRATKRSRIPKTKSLENPGSQPNAATLQATSDQRIVVLFLIDRMAPAPAASGDANALRGQRAKTGKEAARPAKPAGSKKE